MLLDRIVNYCDEKYTAYGDKCGCQEGACNHPSGECSGSCYNCLRQIHYPSIFHGKLLYDCEKMLNHYVCQYSYMYTSEILDALYYKWEYIHDYSYYHILSIGCGGCADLMAFDYLRKNQMLLKPISYIGIDINSLWEPIHSKIKDYCDEQNIKFKVPMYEDVFEIFKEHTLPDTNIIVISYLISSLYNTRKIEEINILIDRLVDGVIGEKKERQRLLLIINDVNSNRRGRDYFSSFENAIKKKGLKTTAEFRHYDNGNLNDYQKLGEPYPNKLCSIQPPGTIESKYHASRYVKQTVQLLIEIE